MKRPILSIIIIFALAIAATYYPWQQSVDNNPDNITEVDDFLVIPETIGNKSLEITDSWEPEVEGVTNTDPGSARTSEQKSMTTDSIVYKYVEPDKPLPSLEESDEEIAIEIKQLADVTELFLFKSFIRHFVVTIDNMTNRKLPSRYVFTHRVPEKFLVIRQDVDSMILDSKNFKRYSSFVSLAERVDTRKLVSVYTRYYSLFQESYEELGYLDRSFNNRLIQVVDHILTTPEVQEPIRLVQPKVFYKFADPELESLSAGQKVLVRIGIDNAQRVKSKLRELRSDLTKFTPP